MSRGCFTLFDVVETLQLSQRPQIMWVSAYVLKSATLVYYLHFHLKRWVTARSTLLFSLTSNAGSSIAYIPSMVHLRSLDIYLTHRIVASQDRCCKFDQKYCFFLSGWEIGYDTNSGICGSATSSTGRRLSFFQSYRMSSHTSMKPSAFQNPSNNPRYVGIDWKAPKVRRDTYKSTIQ